MDSARSYLINLVTDRCLAFSDYIEPLKRRQYSSEFPLILLEVLDNINKAIQETLSGLSSSVDFQSLEVEEVEQHILRYSQLHSYLQEVVSFIERADVPHTVVELIQPLKRLMAPDLKEFELILHPLPVLNYNFYPLGHELSKVIEGLGLSHLLTHFPKQLVTIGFPSLERENFLIHSLIGHELGHCLYLECGLEGQLMPLIKPNEQKLDNLVKDLAQAKASTGFEAEQRQLTQGTLSDYLSEIEIKSYLTRGIIDVSKSWVKELMCDAVAYRLFGTAYLFASLNFLTLLNSFDDDQSVTHPPNRMRFLLLYRMLNLDTTKHPSGKASFLKMFPPKTAEFLKLWRAVTRGRTPQFSDPIRELAGNAILNIYEDIIEVSDSVVEGIGSYFMSEHGVELQKLSERIKMFVPPNEVIENGTSHAVKFQSILNAGWLAYMSELEALGKKYNWEPWECKSKLHGLIARAVELSEIQRRWNEVR